MPALTDIPGIGKASFELLEAAGFHDVDSLACAGTDELLRELERANGILNITKRPPTRANIEKWIRAARKLRGEPDEAPAPEPVMPVDYEQTPAVASMLAAAPCAIPLPGRQLVERGIGVGEIPPGILLNRYSGDLEIRIEDRLPGSSRPPKPLANQYVQVAESQAASKLEIDTARVKSVSEVTPGRSSGRRMVASKPANTVEDRVSLLRAPREETNAGKDPNSRRYIRGVLHPHPWSLRFGAVVTLLLLLLLPLAIASSFLLLLHDSDSDAYQWVRPWWLVFPLALPVAGLGWMIWGMSCSCRICGQKLFVPKKHRKNAKAHHLPLVGYILPLILHLLVFHWFRCTHCGTPVRLRK